MDTFYPQALFNTLNWIFFTHHSPAGANIDVKISKVKYLIHPATSSATR
jgi:hypothetical protein